MSQINPQQFTVEGFPDQQDWIGKLFSPLNQFTGDVVRAFRNQLTIKDNLWQEVKELKFVNDAASVPLRFTTKFNSYPVGLAVVYIYNNTLSAYSTTAPHLEWSWSNGELIINDITNLTASSTYTMRVLVLYG
jgi:hypothetical protein